MRLKNLLLLILFFTTSSLFAQRTITNRVCDTIPYEIIGEKLIIPFKVNGKEYKAIYDSGGQNGFICSAAVEMKARTKGGVRHVGGYGTGGMSFQEAVVDDVVFGGNYVLKTMDVMIFPDMAVMKSLGVVGIVTGQAFYNAVVTIDSKNKILVINSPYRPEKLKATDGIKLELSSVMQPKFDINISGVKQQILFDTGAHGFICLSKEFIEQHKDKIEILETGYGIDKIGIDGLPKPMDLPKVKIESLDFAGKKFKNIETIVSKSGEMIIGLDMIEYGKVVIDYLRGLFYFMPYDDTIPEMKLKKKWNVSIIPSDKFEGFFLSALWPGFEKQAEFGDKVINVNGRDIGEFPLSESAMKEFMDSIEDDNAYIVVEDKNKKQKRVTIKRE